MNHLTHILLALLLTASSVMSQNVTPVEMERLRVSYEAARERATKPLDEKYLAELFKLQATYTKAAKLEAAVAAANEIKRMQERLGLPSSPIAPELAVPAATPSTTPSTGSTKDMEVVIPANSPNGYRLGAVKRGDTITFQYVEGKWKCHGGIASENPDDPKASYGDDDRVVIAEAADAKGAGKVIRLIPLGTASKPYTYAFQTSRDDVVLRINKNSERSGNPGTVTYKVKLVR